MIDILEVIAYFGPAAILAAAASAAIGVALKLGGGRLSLRAPAAQSRLLMVAALAPMLLATVFFWAAVADWLERGPSKCCTAHVQPGHPSVLLIVCALFLLGRVAVGGFRLMRNVFRSHGAIRAWKRCLPVSAESRVVLPLEEPQAFVMGILKPQIFISQGLLTAANSDVLEPLLAHEKAHVRRRDPLRRVAASIGLTVHLPGVAQIIQRLLARAQEMAADAEAVKLVGDGPRVAEALLWFARLRLAQSPAGFEFARLDVGERIRQILERRQQPEAPSFATLIACTVGLGAFALIARRQLHYLSEILLNLP